MSFQELPAEVKHNIVEAILFNDTPWIFILVPREVGGNTVFSFRFSTIFEDWEREKEKLLSQGARCDPHEVNTKFLAMRSTTAVRLQLVSKDFQNAVLGYLGHLDSQSTQLFDPQLDILWTDFHVRGKLTDEVTIRTFREQVGSTAGTIKKLACEQASWELDDDGELFDDFTNLEEIRVFLDHCEWEPDDAKNKEPVHRYLSNDDLREVAKESADIDQSRFRDRRWKITYHAHGAIVDLLDLTRTQEFSTPGAVVPTY